MSNHQKPLNVKTIKELESIIGSSVVKQERLELAHLFRYISQDYNPYVQIKRSFENINYKKYFSDHSETFKKLHFIFRKYGIDIEDFLNYTLRKMKVYTPELILKTEVFKDYSLFKERNRQYEMVYKQYISSVNYIANMCIKESTTPKQYISYLFKSGRIASDYLTGNISKYFLASIQNFKLIFEKLDSISKSELRIIYDASDELNVVANEASIKMSDKYAKPIFDTNEAFNKLIKLTNN